MDYRALAELVWFALLGLTAFTAVSGLTLRFVLGPFLRELIDAYRERSRHLPEQVEVMERLERLERHLVEMDAEIVELRDAGRMDRLLQGESEETHAPRG
jgi:hypothetical protein